MYIVMGADTATNTQPAASPERWAQLHLTLYFYKNNLKLYQLLVLL